MVWWVINDKGNTHTAYPGGLPMGLEIQITASAYASKYSEIVNNSTIYRYQIQNKSSNTYSEFRFTEWADFDLGNADDDYVGCDLSTNNAGKKRNLFYCYNADNQDEDLAALGYGTAPPAVGIAYLSTGKKSDGSDINIASHMFFTNSSIQGVNSDPRDAIELERYMKGLWADGQILSYGTSDGRSGTDTYTFGFPGDTDPNGRPAWYESGVPGDRRSTAGLEPRSFAPGEMMTVELAYVWARDTSNIASREKLRRSVDTLITAHENFFANFSTGIKKEKVRALRIYPNPSSDYLYIEGMNEEQELVIYSSNGEIVMKERISIYRPINISALSNGIYFVRAGNYTGKFVKR
jgi:Secretion system C-terminal sorting domain